MLVTQPCLTLCDPIDCTLLCLSHVNIYTYIYIHTHTYVYTYGSAVKNLPTVQETQKTWVQSLCWKDPLKEEMAVQSSTLAWKSPWTEEPSGYSLWGPKESDTTEQARPHIHTCTYTAEHCSAKKTETLILAVSSWTWDGLGGHRAPRVRLSRVSQQLPAKADKGLVIWYLYFPCPKALWMYGLLLPRICLFQS